SCALKLEWPLGQAPIAVEWRLFLRRQRSLGPLLRVFGALLIAGVVAQPQLHVVLPPTAEEVVEPAAARIASGQVRRLAQAACPQLGVELPVAQVVGMQHVESAQGEVV